MTNIPTIIVNPFALNTNTKINSSLTRNTGLTLVSAVDYLDSQIDTDVSIGVGRTLKFTDCKNVGFRITWTGTSTLVFEGCFLAADFLHFDYLLNINNSTGELRITCRNCYGPTGRPLRDFYWQILGGLT